MADESNSSTLSSREVEKAVGFCNHCLDSQNLVKDLYTCVQLLLALACLELVMADESNSNTLSSREVEKAVGVIRALVSSVPKSTSEEAGESSTG